MAINAETVQKALGQLMALMSPEMLKGFMDNGIDWVEDYIEKTDTKWDDAIGLPILTEIREAIDVPDTGEFADDA